MSYPKFRVYRRRRSIATQKQIWVYLASTTLYPDAETVKREFCLRSPHCDPKTIRVELAATHGYYIED